MRIVKQLHARLPCSFRIRGSIREGAHTFVRNKAGGTLSLSFSFYPSLSHAAAGGLSYSTARPNLVKSVANRAGGDASQRLQGSASRRRAATRNCSWFTRAHMNARARANTNVKVRV